MITKQQAQENFEILGGVIHRKPSCPGYSSNSAKVSSPFFQASKLTGQKGYYSYEQLEKLMKGESETIYTITPKLADGYDIREGQGYSPSGNKVKTVLTSVGKMATEKFLELSGDAIVVKDNKAYLHGKLVTEPVFSLNGKWYFTKAVLRGERIGHESKCPSSIYHEVRTFFSLYPECIYVRKVEGFDDLTLTLSECPDMNL